MTVIALVQGWYFVVTGLWPLLHIASFQKVTSRKTDLWLVNTVGLLLLLIASGLILAALAWWTVSLLATSHEGQSPISPFHNG